MVLPCFISLVPLGMFFVASTNPSSWAILSAATTFVTMFGALQTTGRRQIALSFLAAFAGILGTMARTDAGIFALFAIAISLLVTGTMSKPRKPIQLAPLMAMSIVAVAAMISFLNSTQGTEAATGLPLVGGEAVLTDPLTAAEIGLNAVLMPLVWVGVFGLGPLGSLGWLDTPPPAITGILMFVVALGALISARSKQTRAQKIALLICLFALWALPFILLLQSNATINVIVQSRYILPLVIITFAIAFAVPVTETMWSTTQRYLAIIAIAIANSAALCVNMKRYTIGLGASIDTATDNWWWDMPLPSPTAVWLASSMAPLVLGIYLVRLSSGSSKKDSKIRH